MKKTNFVLYFRVKWKLPLIRFDMTFATYYAKKRGEGKPHRVAITHVAKKLIRVIYALERQDIDFNAQKSLWNYHLPNHTRSNDRYLVPWNVSFPMSPSASIPYSDIVNIGLHFFLKDVRPMLPPVMNRSIVDA